MKSKNYYMYEDEYGSIWVWEGDEYLGHLPRGEKKMNMLEIDQLLILGKKVKKYMNKINKKNIMDLPMITIKNVKDKLVLDLIWIYEHNDNAIGEDIDSFVIKQDIINLIRLISNEIGRRNNYE